jgi:hypothetical protein
VLLLSIHSTADFTEDVHGFARNFLFFPYTGPSQRAKFEFVSRSLPYRRKQRRLRAPSEHDAGVVVDGLDRFLRQKRVLRLSDSPAAAVEPRNEQTGGSAATEGQLLSDVKYA